MRKPLFLVALLMLPAAGAAQDETVSIELEDPGFEHTEPGSKPAGLGGNMLPAGAEGPGYTATIDAVDPASGAASLLIESQGVIEAGGFGTFTRSLDVEALRGRKIRLTGKARVGLPAAKHVGFWLRVDRPGGKRGFFDNMRGRPITSSEWQTYSIEGDVAADASKVYFGFLVQGEGKAWVDDLRIEDIGPADAPHFEGIGTDVGPTRSGPVEGDLPAAAISDQGLQNLQTLARVYGLVRWFHASDQAAQADWGRVLIGAIPQVEAAQSPDELAAVLRTIFRPIAPTMQISVGGSTVAIPRPVSDRHLQWTYNGFPSSVSQVYSAQRSAISANEAPAAIVEALASGLVIDMPLSVPVNDDGHTLPAIGLPVADAGKPAGWVPAGFDRTTRIAGIISGWSMFSHFYPYWDVVDTDWDAALAPRLREAALAPGDIAYRDVLLRLVEGLDDGHGGVNYRLEGRAILPLDWAWIEDELVITAAPAAALDKSGYAPGMIVRAVSGVPARDAISAKKALISGSEQWKTARALSLLRQSHETGERTLLVETATGEQNQISLPLNPMNMENWVREALPEVVSELDPGIVYVDIDRLTDAQFAVAKTQIEAAKGLIFDLRGYPTGRYEYLSHLTDVPIQSAEMNVPRQTRPDAQFDEPSEGGWKLQPALPRYTENVVFITDGGAISWSESILGTVKANNLATIIGAPTAGANGNVTTFRVPGGYELRWTGMEVKNRDGTQHHILGVQPDILVGRTLAGVRAGRDELLDAAIAEVTRQIAED